MNKNAITFPQGFTAAGISCGIKKNGNKDLALICSDVPSVGAGVFTTNVVKGHSLLLTMQNIKNDFTKAVLINSGNANACIGEEGDQIAKTAILALAKELNCNDNEILFGSTGVIGIPLNINNLIQGITQISKLSSIEGANDAKDAILTTDLISKESTRQFELNNKIIKIGGIAKGSGMIHPNMATMIGIITTDISISKEMLQIAIKEVCDKSFNRISVDGDTSVCDMVVILANGIAQNDTITSKDTNYNIFIKELEIVCTELAKMVVKDGEGATKLIQITVNGANSKLDAYKIVTSVAKSPLVKTAFFGEDANWGRILTACGYSEAKFDPNLVDIYIGDLLVCKNGCGLSFDENLAKKILQEHEINVTINLHIGNFTDRIWTCDFSYDYVKINGSYRS